MQTRETQSIISGPPNSSSYRLNVDFTNHHKEERQNGTLKSLTGGNPIKKFVLKRLN